MKAKFHNWTIKNLRTMETVRYSSNFGIPSTKEAALNSPSVLRWAKGDPIKAFPTFKNLNHETANTIQTH